jgi:hypothetical protein
MHFIRINLQVGLVFALFYYIVLRCVKYYYRNNLKNILIGLGISIVALVIQETLGHQYGGDEPSRLEGVPNAIMYANYYAVGNFLTWK